MGVYYSNKRARWVVSYTDPRGKRIRQLMPEDKRLNTKKAAEAELSKVRVDIAEKRYVVAADVPTFADAAARYVEAKRDVRETTRADTKRLVDWYLVPYFGKRKVNEISLGDCREFARTLRDGLPAWWAEAQVELRKRHGLRGARAIEVDASKRTGLKVHPWTINRSLDLLQQVFDDARAHRWRHDNPAEFVARERARDEDAYDADHVLTVGEGAALIAAAADPYSLLIEFALKTGARKGEILALRWGDLDLKGGTAVIQRTTKNGRFSAPKASRRGRVRVRSIELPDDLVRRLREARLKAPLSKSDDLVFGTLSSEGKAVPISHKTVDAAAGGFKASLAKVGLADRRFHDLRHTHATWLISKGWDVADVARRLGHANPEVTLRVYTHAFATRPARRQDINDLSAAISGTKVATLTADPSDANDGARVTA